MDSAFQLRVPGEGDESAKKRSPGDNRAESSPNEVYLGFCVCLVRECLPTDADVKALRSHAKSSTVATESRVLLWRELKLVNTSFLSAKLTPRKVSSRRVGVQ